MRKLIENLRQAILPSDFLLFQRGDNDECCGNHCCSIYFMLTREDYLSRMSDFFSISIMILLLKYLCSWRRKLVYTRGIPKVSFPIPGKKLNDRTIMKIMHFIYIP